MWYWDSQRPGAQKAFGSLEEFTVRVPVQPEAQGLLRFFLSDSIEVIDFCEC
jgi:hypothetical protein